MSDKELNQSLYDASLQALREHQVPDTLAIKASEIIATDDGSKPDFGRTEEDREIISQTLPYLQGEKE